jgi:hypothetical protein
LENENQCHALLNRMISRSVTRSRSYDAPTMSGYELLRVLERRRRNGHAIEFLGAPDDDDDVKRIAKGHGHDFIRLRHLRFEETASYRYATLLIEFVDESVRSFPVVHVQKFTGREIAGDEEERGAWAAHMVIRLPLDDAHDDGEYRCAIEQMHRVTRRDIELLLSRQLRRYSEQQSLSFTVEVEQKRGRAKTLEFRYHPRLELHADVGRTLGGSLDGGRVLTQMVFTQRKTKQSIGKPTVVDHQDFVADLEIRVSAKQGPKDPEEHRGWVTEIRDWYQQLGYEARMYFRHPGGGALSGNLDQDVAGATDLLMCPKEIISLSGPRRYWRDRIDGHIATELKGLVDQDNLWERGKS